MSYFCYQLVLQKISYSHLAAGCVYVLIVLAPWWLDGTVCMYLGFEKFGVKTFYPQTQSPVVVGTPPFLTTLPAQYIFDLQN